ASRGGPVGIPARPANLDPPPFARGPAGRNLGRAARGLGGCRAAGLRLAHARLLDRRPEHRSPARGDAEPREPRVARPLRCAGRDRVAPVRRAVRAVRGGQPGDPAERAERALAAPLDAEIRADDLPALSGARVGRRPAARSHGDPRGQLAPARCRRRPVGTLAMGRMRTATAAIASMFCLVLLLAGTACGERKEPTGAVVRIYPVTVQGAEERPTSLRAAPQRIVPLGSGPRRILRALGLQKRIVTVNDELVGLPLVGEIRRAHPDLIVASEDADPLDLARASAA